MRVVTGEPFNGDGRKQDQMLAIHKARIQTCHCKALAKVCNILRDGRNVARQMQRVENAHSFSMMEAGTGMPSFSEAILAIMSYWLLCPVNWLPVCCWKCPIRESICTRVQSFRAHGIAS